jgi:hypothetical protein
MATNNTKLINALTVTLSTWRDSGKMTSLTLETAIDSVIGVLQSHKQDTLVTLWEGYKGLEYSQSEYKQHWSPYNGSKKASEGNALPPQMVLKNARRMTDNALKAQLETVFDNGNGWGRLSRATSFTGARTDSRVSEEENKARLERIVSARDELTAREADVQQQLAAKAAKRQAAKEAAAAAKAADTEKAGATE